jgi:hypothetical protein
MPLFKKFLITTKFSRDLRKKISQVRQCTQPKTSHSGEFVQLFLQLKNNKYYTPERALLTLVIQQCACPLSSSVACPTVSYFFHVSHKQHNFRKQLLNIRCVFQFSLQLPCEALNEKCPKTYIGIHVKYLLFLVRF